VCAELHPGAIKSRSQRSLSQEDAQHGGARALYKVLAAAPAPFSFPVSTFTGGPVSSARERVRSVDDRVPSSRAGSRGRPRVTRRGARRRFRRWTSTMTAAFLAQSAGCRPRPWPVDPASAASASAWLRPANASLNAPCDLAPRRQGLEDLLRQVRLRPRPAPPRPTAARAPRDAPAARGGAVTAPPPRAAVGADGEPRGALGTHQPHGRRRCRPPSLLRTMPAHNAAGV